jgi:minor histocompatibility antigen H13
MHTGIFLALLLRFDYKNSERIEDVKRVYFFGTLVAYVLGLLTTVLVMYAFNAAQVTLTTHLSPHLCLWRSAHCFSCFYLPATPPPQPALLYLVPACLLSSMGIGAARGQFRALFSFSETPADPAAPASPAAGAPHAGKTD